VSSHLYVERLATKAGEAKESAVATVPNCTAYSNAAASARRRAGREHAGTGSNIHLSKYSTAKHAVLCVVVRKGEDRRDGASNVLATAGAVKGKAAERDSILPQQSTVRSNS
jgi:hypothetical protein